MRARHGHGIRTLGTALALAGALAALPGSALAASSEDPDWPCIQRKMPKISAGMMWAGPPFDEADAAWRADAEVSELVARVAQRATPLEDAKQAVSAFASGLAGNADKDGRLTLLFAGTLATVNAERASIMAGIQRYARRQRALAGRIEQQTAAAASSEGEARATLQEQIAWDTRIFEERERSLTYVCEQPVLLEQRVFALAREIMNYLD